MFTSAATVFYESWKEKVEWLLNIRAEFAVQRILALLSQGPKSYKELLRDCGVSHAALDKHLKRMEEGGYIKKVREKVFPPKAVYMLNPAAKKAADLLIRREKNIDSTLRSLLTNLCFAYGYHYKTKLLEIDDVKRLINKKRELKEFFEKQGLPEKLAENLVWLLLSDEVDAEKLSKEIEAEILEAINDFILSMCKAWLSYSEDWSDKVSYKNLRPMVKTKELDEIIDRQAKDAWGQAIILFPEIVYHFVFLNIAVETFSLLGINPQKLCNLIRDFFVAILDHNKEMMETLRYQSILEKGEKQVSREIVEAIKSAKIFQDTRPIF